jgi:DNA polymerase-3 subunit chi
MGSVFFIETTKKEKDVLICRLAEFFFLQKNTVQIITSGINRQRELDSLLWTFSKESFVPHKIINAEPAEPLLDPVVISLSEFHLFSITIFDSSVSPSSISDKKTSIIFVVKDDSELLNQSREIWKTVKASNIPVYHIKNSDFESIENELKDQLFTNKRGLNV